MNKKHFRRRTIQINLRVTEQEKTRIDGNATVNGMSVSEYLRHLLLLSSPKMSLKTY